MTVLTQLRGSTDAASSRQRTTAEPLVDPLQRKVLQARSLTASPIQRAKVPIPSGGGSPLDDSVRGKMESSFGADFSSVRVHHGDTASKLGAAAFTQGDNVHFAPGQYNTSNLGHELAHVVQQRQGRVSATGSVGGQPLNDNPGLEREADQAAARAMRSG